MRGIQGLRIVLAVGLLAATLLLAGCGEPFEVAHTSAAQDPTASPDSLSTQVAMAFMATPVPTLTPAAMMVTATPPPVTQVAPGFTVYPTNTARPAPPTLTPTTLLPREDHYWFDRSFPRDPTNRVVDYLSRTYPYGSTGGGQYQVHHGVDIPNVLGTRIQAANSGWVTYAGDDYTRKVGPQTDFYGNVVIIENSVPAPNGQPIYTLYGHMSQVYVQAGQRISAGTEIGEVGAEGVALGSHLHLEVRIGDPFDYGSTLNPDLWVKPWDGYGTLAGKVTEPDGTPVYDATVIIRGDTPPDTYTYTYADDTVNPDPVFGENFTRGDLPAGHYRVFVRVEGEVRFQADVDILPGRTTWLDAVLK
ncbi:peptidoglycan DD-metalloendopeptidase family protein [Aggregatilinea lenta]|uniref:peptidoglycan DD-metalloendopeptidase family protein n=1 Tax=Aggregatilinea lenta TaxID=913108 RepID=UPI0013C364AA|nr:peptidoglycan DD-metalloendopeptidase family protein [Aggregatilinea lenta]